MCIVGATANPVTDYYTALLYHVFLRSVKYQFTKNARFVLLVSSVLVHFQKWLCAEAPKKHPLLRTLQGPLGACGTMGMGWPMILGPLKTPELAPVEPLLKGP